MTLKAKLMLQNQEKEKGIVTVWHNKNKKSAGESEENNKGRFGQLGELTSILFEDFGLSIGLSSRGP